MPGLSKPLLAALFMFVVIMILFIALSFYTAATREDEFGLLLTHIL